MRGLAALGKAVALLGLGLMMAGCAANDYPTAPDAVGASGAEAPDYRIGPLDNLEIFVWRAPDLAATIPVRPDGRISTPLVDDMVAAGKTPTQLARDLEEALTPYVQDPVVTVLVEGFVGPFSQQVRVVGEAQEPTAIPYRTGMTVLDVMITVGGLTEFAAGNGAVLIRGPGADARKYALHLDDLLRDGDISANVPVLPGDIILIPESWL